MSRPAFPWQNVSQRQLNQSGSHRPNLRTILYVICPSGGLNCGVSSELPAKHSKKSARPLAALINKKRTNCGGALLKGSNQRQPFCPLWTVFGWPRVHNCYKDLRSALRNDILHFGENLRSDGNVGRFVHAGRMLHSRMGALGHLCEGRTLFKRPFPVGDRLVLDQFPVNVWRRERNTRQTQSRLRFGLQLWSRTI
jgi:hypothetical protein